MSERYCTEQSVLKRAGRADVTCPPVFNTNYRDKDNCFSCPKSKGNMVKPLFKEPDYVVKTPHRRIERS